MPAHHFLIQGIRARVEEDWLGGGVTLATWKNLAAGIGFMKSVVDPGLKTHHPEHCQEENLQLQCGAYHTVPASP